MKSPIVNMNKQEFINFEPSDEELKKIEEEIDKFLNENN